MSERAAKKRWVSVFTLSILPDALSAWLACVIALARSEHLTPCGVHLFKVITLHISSDIISEIGSAARRLKNNVINNVANKKDRFASVFESRRNWRALRVLR